MILLHQVEEEVGLVLHLQNVREMNLHIHGDHIKMSLKLHHHGIYRHLEEEESVIIKVLHLIMMDGRFQVMDEKDHDHLH